MQVPKRKPGKYAPGPADYHLTPAAVASLKEELERIETLVRPKAVEELRRTRDMGDLSENYAYSAAKGRLLGLDTRVLEIKDRLKRAIIITPGAGTGGTIRIGATVTIEANGRQRTFEITGSQETDPSGGRISYLSPLGAALMKHAIGETVTVTINGKPVDYRVIDVH